MTTPLIAALADGFQAAGVVHSFNYPGFHSNELHDALGGGVTSVNERTAMATGWGAALAGGRSVVSFKNVGLNDAADPFLHSVLLGCNAALVVALFEDCDIQHSQNRMDSRPYFGFFGGLWLEPRTIQEACDWARESVLLSEYFGVPVVLRLTNILYSQTTRHRLSTFSGPLPPPDFVRDPSRWVVHPAHAAGQEMALKARQKRIDAAMDERFCADPDSGWNLDEPAERIIFGANRDVSVRRALRLATLPLPVASLRRHFRDKALVPVYESGQPYVANQIQQLLAPGIDARLMNNRRLRYKYHCRSDYEFLYGAIRNVPGRIVSGDLGEYTMDPDCTLDACLCYGASVAVAGGIALQLQAEPDRAVFAITGDAAFAHAGVLAYEEIVARQLPVTVIVIDNGGARGTGGQAVPGGVQRLDGFSGVRRFRQACDQERADLLDLIAQVPSQPRLLVIEMGSKGS